MGRKLLEARGRCWIIQLICWFQRKVLMMRISF
uniref:Uncharacterized protein n=1 Tax=Lotus japonicus TaxID=34305 RepID=I3T4Q4_LOTJA|nr:unknown [Lotus japonicus]